MNRTSRWIIGLAALVFMQCVHVGAAEVDSYPSRSPRIIVPYPPGGGGDIVARTVGDRLGTILKQPFLVDNRGGGAGVPANDFVAKAAPDGYTLLLGQQTGLVINPLISTTKLPYDPFHDFAPISLLYRSPMLVVVINDLPVHSIKDLIALAKKMPGKLNYASAGIGASNHIAVEMFKYMTGTDIVHVPYKGFAPAIIDVLAGAVQIKFNPVTALLPYVKSGKLRAIAVSSTERIAVLPQVPTIAESGVPGYQYYLWYSLVAPAKTPPSIIHTLNREIVKIIAEPATAERFIGAQPVSSTPEELVKLIREEYESTAKVVKAANIKAE